MSGDKLSVKTICQLTGINEHTLRAWERRYQVVIPDRLDNGRRVYSLSDLEKLKLISKLIQNGFLISHIAGQSTDELNKLLKDADVPVEAQRNKSSSSDLQASLKRALADFDFVQVRKILARSRIELTVKDFIFEIVLPFCRASQNTSDLIKKTQKRGLKSLLCAELTQMKYDVMDASDSSGKVRSFTIAGLGPDVCEMTLLAAGVFCAMKGFAVRYLGTDLSVEELDLASRQIGFNTLLVATESADTSRFSANSLINGLSEPKELWLIGHDGFISNGDYPLPIKLLADLSEFEYITQGLS